MPDSHLPSSQTDPQTAPGTVFLVGAGPGDPGLLTLAGRDALVKADVVVYDRLAHPSLLHHAPDSAEKIFVGKASALHFVRQEDTNDLIAARALQGKTVVRLKGGDPFVFGRGGEEAEFLRARDVPFVIVPGITSAIAAPAYAGIPVTHRDAASSFAVITGHERDDKTESGTREGGKAEGRRQWDKIAWAADTLVFLMGVEALSEICARLMENGRDANTPVALVQWGTWTKQRVVVGTLQTIVQIVQAEKITAPAVTIIGEVVNFREKLRWFDTGPLFGKRVLVTRAREQASEFADKLLSFGAEPVEFPMLSFTAPSDNYAALDSALADLSRFDWMVFTSANGVKHAFERMEKRGKDSRALSPVKVAAVGPATCDALQKRGITPDFVPLEFVSEAVAREFPESLIDTRILLARAENARDTLPDLLRDGQARVTNAPAYTSVISTSGADAIKQQLADGDIDVITFASSNTVRNFVEAIGGAENVPNSVLLAAIGPVTADTCRELLRAPDCTASQYTINGLIAAVTETLAKKASKTP